MNQITLGFPTADSIVRFVEFEEYPQDKNCLTIEEMIGENLFIDWSNNEVVIKNHDWIGKTTIKAYEESVK